MIPRAAWAPAGSLSQCRPHSWQVLGGQGPTRAWQTGVEGVSGKGLEAAPG